MQATETSINMPRTECIWSGVESMTTDVQEYWQYYDWAGENHRKYLAYRPSDSKLARYPQV